MAKRLMTSRIFSSAIVMAAFIFSLAQFSLCLKSVEPLRQQFPTTSFAEQMSLSNAPGLEVMLYADPMDISAKPKIGNCVTENKAYGPNTEMIMATTAMSWLECQRQCEFLESCAFFNVHLTYFVDNCYLYRSTALHQYNIAGVISGPKRCGNPFSCVHHDVDMPGHDIDEKTVDNEEQCRKRCLLHPNCEFYYYVLYNGKKVCWRKRKSAVNSIIFMRKNTGTRVGPRHCHPQWCFMNDISLKTSGENLITTLKNIDSATSCQLKCQENQECQTWTYKVSRDCFLLHSDLSEKQNALDSISGLRNCGNPIHDIADKNFEGPDLRVASDISSTEKCQEECYKDFRCHFFTYNMSNRNCYLHPMVAISRPSNQANCKRGAVIPGVTTRPPNP